MRDIINAVRGYNNRQEEQFKYSWEQARFIAGWATMKDNRKLVNMKFPWEKGGKPSPDGLKALAEHFSQLDKAVKQKLENG